MVGVARLTEKALTLLATVEELDAVLDEFPGNVEDFLNRVGHCGLICV